MQKPLALSIAACLGLAGCQVFEKSETWSQALQVRPGETTRDPDPSNAYAAKLHAALSERGIEHKVVVYQYRYTTRLREEAVGTRTAVIYRDNSNPRYPWWLKDDRLNKPFWLPDGELNVQVSFYLRRKAEVIEQKDYPAQGGSGKTALAFAKPAPALRPVVKKEAPVARTTITRITPVKKVTAPVVAPKPAPKPEIVKAPEVKKTVPKIVAVKPVVKEPTAPAPVTKIKPATAANPIAKFFSPPSPAEPETAPLPPITSRNTGSNVQWSPPAALDTAEQSQLTAPRNEHLEKLFREKNGTDYNRFSPMDRRKMQQLQNGVASLQ
jgi:hypothetical protein